MNVLAALAQSSEPTGLPTVVVMIMMGALALVLGLARLLRRTLSVLTRLLVSAGAVMTGIATTLAMSAAVTTVLLVYLR